MHDPTTDALLTREQLRLKLNAGAIRSPRAISIRFRSRA